MQLQQQHESKKFNKTKQVKSKYKNRNKNITRTRKNHQKEESWNDKSHLLQAYNNVTVVVDFLWIVFTIFLRLVLELFIAESSGNYCQRLISYVVTIYKGNVPKELSSVWRWLTLLVVKYLYIFMVVSLHESD